MMKYCCSYIQWCLSDGLAEENADYSFISYSSWLLFFSWVGKRHVRNESATAIYCRGCPITFYCSTAKKAKPKNMLIRGIFAEAFEVEHTHDDTVLLAGLHADRRHVADVDGAQRAEEAGLTVLVAGQQLPVRHHQATRDARRGRHALRDDLQVGHAGGESSCRFSDADVLQATHPFGDGLAEQLHPLGHVLLVVGAELQRGALCQDDLEGVGALGAV